MTVGIICEKPSAAKHFATALGGRKGTYNGESYVIANLVGHCYELDDPSKQVPSALEGRYKSWDVSNLPWSEGDFAWKYVVKKKAADVVKQAVSVLSSCDEIAIATDDDPSGEGSLLAYEVIANNRLTPRKFTRLYFSDESAPSIQKAFKERKTVPDLDTWGELNKAKFRAHWDFMSMQWTRVATKLAGQRGVVLRNGRLKSAMVRLVGDQLKAVEEYVRKPFYQNRFRDENDVVYTSAKEPTFEKPEQVPQTYKPSDVVCDSKTDKATPPPKLIDLATLSARLAPKGYAAKGVLDVYQKMYEANVVSYPRTEDKCITAEQFNELLPKVDAIAALVGVDASLLTHRTQRKTHVKDGMAHGANRPGPNVPASLEELDDRFGRGAAEIYKMLAKSYLCMLAEDYLYEQQKGHVKDYPDFKGTANVPRSMGWKAIDMDASDADADESAKGLGTHAEPFVYEGANPKPQKPTQKWLMAQLERRDIGTGATRTSTYADVTSKAMGILVDKRGVISFGDTGQMTYLMLPGTHIADLDMTKRVQDQMKQVEQGADEMAFLHEIQQMIVDDIATMRQNAATMRSTLNLTESAGSAEKVEGVWNGEAVSFYRTFCGHTFTDDEVSRLLAGETVEVKGAVSKSGRKFDCKGKLGRDDTYGVHFELVRDMTDRYAGTFTGAGKHKGEVVTFRRVLAGYTFTDEECEELLRGGEVEFTGTSKKGSPFMAVGKLGDDRKYGFGIRMSSD